MSDSDRPRWQERDVATLGSMLHRGSQHASGQLAKWLERPSILQIDSLRVMPLADATELLAQADTPICFCAMQMCGEISGEIILAFDDASGLALVDMVLGNAGGQTTEWSELALSAVLETTNIVCCAYLNSLSESIGDRNNAVSLVPLPPRFGRDYAQSLLEFALMGQAMESDQVIVAKTLFEVEHQPVGWNLLFVPDAESMDRLPRLLANSSVDDSSPPADEDVR